MATGQVLIEAGAGPPYAPLQYGLLSAAEVPPSPPDRWRMGILREEPPCDAAGSIPSLPCPPVSGMGAWDPTVDSPGMLAPDVFRVYAWAPCSVVGWGDDLAGLRTRTIAALTNGEGRAMEHVVWTGQPTVTGAGISEVYPHLAENTAVTGTPHSIVPVTRQTAATVVTSGPENLVVALGLLEGALAECYGAEGVIHVPRQALAHLSNLGLLRREGQTLRTWSGNRVAAYASNDRHGPTGAEPGSANETWIYATGAVLVLRSPIIDHGQQPAEFIGREANTTLYIVERAYSVTWDCCHLAAQAELWELV